MTASENNTSSPFVAEHDLWRKLGPVNPPVNPPGATAPGCLRACKAAAMDLNALKPKVKAP